MNTSTLTSQLDPAKTAGLLVIGAVIVLAALRRGFGGVNITVGS